MNRTNHYQMQSVPEEKHYATCSARHFSGSPGSAEGDTRS